MESSTTIKKMLSGNSIFVPDYQRAYSWETEIDKSKTPKQVNVFLSDLIDYIKSTTKSPYYFGHFLFEEKLNDKFGVIDGQQRLTTIVIFLSALFNRLKLERKLTEKEQETFEDIIKRNSTYRFETVGYDDQLFKDYVINQTKKDHNGLDTVSAKRIVKAFDYFTEQFSRKDENELQKLLSAIEKAVCSTYIVKHESEAIQMFIFQNNRGKKPSNLEIIKAQFMFNVHLYGNEEKEELINEIKNRFKKIYESISSIEQKIDEDDVLIYTQRVYFNSLWESNAIEKVNMELSKDTRIDFIKNFTQALAASFDHLKTFFANEKKFIEIHSLVTLGNFTIAIPFIIKAYIFGLHPEEINKLCSILESLILRNRLIGTRADLISRINEVYQNFNDGRYNDKQGNPLPVNKSIQPIIDRIDWMKTIPNENWRWAYWNNNNFKQSLQGGMNPTIAKFLLWKYENYLERIEENGYLESRFDKIESPELEHIAPQTGNPETGYGNYDEEFINQYINCLGNYLLISKSHNCSVGNKPFEVKRASYSHLKQQEEIQKMTENDRTWDKDKISQRKENIINFIMENF
jgi:hypothetical protein